MTKMIVFLKIFIMALYMVIYHGFKY